MIGGISGLFTLPFLVVLSAQVDPGRLPPVDLGASVQRVLIFCLLFLLVGWGIHYWIKAHRNAANPVSSFNILKFKKFGSDQTLDRSTLVKVLDRQSLRPGVELVVVRWRDREYLLGVHPERTDVIGQTQLEIDRPS